MKNLAIALLLPFTFACYGQETDTGVTDRRHEVKAGAVKLLAGAILEGTYEYIRNSDFTFGASLLYNFDQDNEYPEDISVTPFVRFYFQETKEYGAKGFFVEGFAKYTRGRDIYENSSVEIEEEYDTGALGLSLGKKWMNRTGFVFEVLVGAGRNLGGSDAAPDVVFRGDLFLGYRF